MTEPAAVPIITPADLEPFAKIDPVKATAMIEDAVALAGRVAPCIADDTLEPEHRAAVRAILRGAILRWNDTGSGARSAWQQGAGSFQVSQTLDNRTSRQGLLWPSEITQLQQICKIGAERAAYEIETVPSSSWPHVRFCPALTGGSCRCGGVLIG